jgi:hypothetical protein
LVNAKKAAKLMSEGKKMLPMIAGIEMEILDNAGVYACQALINQTFPPNIIDEYMDTIYAFNEREQARLAEKAKRKASKGNSTVTATNRAQIVVRIARLPAPPVTDDFCSAGVGDNYAWFARAYRGQGAIVHIYQHCCATACRNEESRLGVPSAAVDSCCVACNRYSCNPMSHFAKLSTEVASLVTAPALDDSSDAVIVRLLTGL